MTEKIIKKESKKGARKMIKKTILPLILLSLFSSCTKKEVDPCLKSHGASNCTELFEKIQQNLGDIDKSKELRDCYDKVCR